VNPCAVQRHDSVTRSFSKNHGQKQHTRNQEPTHKSILDTSSMPVLTAEHPTRTTHTTTHAPTINKNTYPATCKYHSIITQVLALFHTPTDSLIQVSPSFYSLPQIVSSHTGKTLHGISQHGTPTTVKGLMTPKGAQLNNHVHTHTPVIPVQVSRATTFIVQ